MEKEEKRSRKRQYQKSGEKNSRNSIASYTIRQMKAECDEFYRQVDELIANESSLEEMERFMEKNEDLITAGQVFTAWSKEQMWKMLDAKKD